MKQCCGIPWIAPAAGSGRASGAEVVNDALSFRAPERAPVFDSFWPEFTDAWRERRCPDSECDIATYYGVDMAVCVGLEQFYPSRVGRVGEDESGELHNDGWGRIVRVRPKAFFTETVERVLNSRTDLDRLEFEPTDRSERYTGLVSAAEKNRKAGRAVFVKIGGPFIRSSFLRGEMELLIDMASDRSFAAALFERVGSHLQAIGLESLRVTRAGDFGVWIYDDMCSSLGPMFSPAAFEQLLLPVYVRTVSALKSAGARWVFLHCDGNVAPLLDLLLNAGIDGINPVEPGAGLRVPDLMDRYGRKLRYVGGICNAHVLPSGDRKRIRKHALEVAMAGRNGGVVVGSHSIGPDVAVADYEYYRQVLNDSWQT